MFLCRGEYWGSLKSQAGVMVRGAAPYSCFHAAARDAGSLKSVV